MQSVGALAESEDHFVFILAHFVLANFCLAGVFRGEPASDAQSPSNAVAAGALSTQSRQASSFVNLDIYILKPGNAAAEETAAVTLFTTDGQLYKQGITAKGRWQVTEVAPGEYEIQVIAPGFDRTVQQLEARGTGEVRVNVQLRPQAGADKSYLPASLDPEVNYIFGLYASRLGDWEQAKSYWTKVLQLRPEYVPAMVSMSEVLISENKPLEAREYLVRAEKLDPAYWRTQAALGEVALRAGATGEAVLRAQRAMELGHEEAASVSPLLARALVARANEVLRAYLKDHAEDVAARKELEGLNASSEFRASDPPSADSREMSSAMTSSNPFPRTGANHWLPADVDEKVPSVEAGTACNLDEVLEKAGKRIQEFVGNVDRFTATESLVHETLTRSGNISGTEKRKYDYVVSIEEIRPGILDLQEYERSGSAPADSPGGMTTKGLSALSLIFHPYYSGAFSMRCEGMATLNGKRTWQIYFRQRKDKPNQIRSFRAGLNKSYPVDLKGRAWIVADNYQILGLQTDLIGAIPDIRLTAEHTAIEYGPVHFGSRGMDMWLPQTAEVYMELRGKRLRRRISFSNYLLFAVDDKQQIAAPKATPSSP